MKNSYVTLFVIWLVVGHACALVAQTLKGSVTDLDGQSLPSAQVLLRSGDDILGFAMTDVDGRFSLDLKNATTTATVEVRFFGYANWVSPLAELDATSLLRVSLRQEGVELKEVVVAASALPRVNKGDTIIHRTDAYRDGTEKKIEEVIAKLPGVEIDDNGKIEVQGKPLDRILVDGEDLFDKNYRLLSRNVPADFVNRIDILTSYQQDQLIGDLSGKKETVLNLHLDPDKKRPLFGEVTARLGNQRTRAANTSLFHLGKRVKTVNFSDYGTLGHESGVGVDLLNRSQGLSSRPLQPLQSILHSEATRQYRLVREEDYLNNEAFGTAQTLLYRLNNKTKNRLIFNLSGEDYNLSDDRLRETITSNRVDSFQQDNKYRYRTRRYWALNDFDMLLDKKSRIDLRIGVVGAINRAKVLTLNKETSADLPDTLGTDLRERPASYLVSTRYVRRLSPTTALRVNGSWQREYMDQVQDYRGGIYTSLIESPEAILVIQSMNQRRTETNVQIDLLSQLKLGRITYTAGYREKRSAIDAELAADSRLSGSNVDFYRLKEAYLQTALNIKRGKLSGDLSLLASYFQLPAASSVERLRGMRAPALQPSLNIEYALSRRSTISLWGNSTRRIQRPGQLISTPYLAGNSSFNIGLDSGYLERSYKVGLRYAYDNKFDQLGYSGSLDYRMTPNSVGNAVIVDDFIILDQLVAGFPSTVQSGNLSVYKYFSKIKTSFKIKLRQSQMNNMLNFGGELLPSVTNTYSAGITTTTHISKLFRYGFRFDYSSFGNSIGGTKSQQHQVFAEQNITSRISKYINVSFRHRAYLPRLGKGRSIHFMEAKCFHDFKEKGIRITLGILNLLNETVITERNISIYQRYTRSYRLRARSVYVEASKTF